MKTVKILCLYIFLTTFFTNAMAQGGDDEKAIQEVIKVFQNSISNKDKDSFSKLFVDNPISWVGNGSLGERYGNPTGFMNMIASSSEKLREDFHNITVWHDHLIAVVSFDYGFFANDMLTNWGKESWMLIKKGGKWKITSLNFSIILPHQQDYPFD